MSKKSKKIVILTEVELRKTISRLTCEIIEKVKKLDNLLLIGIPTRGIALTEVLEKELFSRTGLRVRKGTIDPTFYRDDQNRVGTRIIKATDIPLPIEKKEIVLADEISPDTCRLWDAVTEKKLDKDRFRNDLGNIIEAYQEIAKRFGIIHEQSNIRPLKFSKPKEVKFKKNK